MTEAHPSTDGEVSKYGSEYQAEIDRIRCRVNEWKPQTETNRRRHDAIVLLGEINRLRSQRDELRAIVAELVPAARNILWCALVWNDHNFDHEHLFNNAKAAAKSLGYERIDGVDPVNAWLERVDKALKRSRT